MSEICLQVDTAEGAVQRLEAALAAVPVACVIIAGRTAATVRTLVDLAQKRNAAALVVDDPALAKAVGADGLHLTASEDSLERYARARKALGDGATIGGDAGTSRHLAMELGEAGADYVAFGPDEGDGGAAGRATGSAALDSDGEPAEEAAEEFEAEVPKTQIERAIWWTELFEVPCLALGIEAVEVAADLADGGVDFVGVTLTGGRSVGDTIAGLHAIAAAVAEPGADA